MKKIPLILVVSIFTVSILGCGKSLRRITETVSNNPGTTPFESQAPENLPDYGDTDLGKDYAATTTFSDGTSASSASYVDMATCKTAACHKTITEMFERTEHGTAWNDKVAYFDTYAKQGRKYCVLCHTVNATFIDVNGDRAYTAGTDLTAFGITPVDYQSQISATNLPSAAVPAEYKGIQCENCHGPASLHTAGDNGKIVKGKRGAFDTGGPAGSVRVCAACHSQPKEWRKSLHSIAMLIDPKNPAEHAAEYITGTSGSCAGCHSGEGFITAVSNGYEPKNYSKTDANYSYNINCVTCHDPHKKTGNKHQLRVSETELCGKCHNQRYGRGAYTGTSSGSGSNTRLVHQPQREMILGGTGTEGESGYDFNGSLISSGPAMGSTSCVDCHMYSYTDRSKGIEWLGHTFNPRAEACEKCHGGIDAKYVIGLKTQKFNDRYTALEAKLKAVQEKFEKQIQTDKNSTSYSLTPSGYTDRRCGKTLKDGYTEYASWAKRCAWTEFNLKFVHEDHSKSVHNTAYANKLMDEAEKMLAWLEGNSMQ